MTQFSVEMNAAYKQIFTYLDIVNWISAIIMVFKYYNILGVYFCNAIIKW